MKILVTGGSGFIGSSIIDYAINKKLIKSNIDTIYILSRTKKPNINKKYIKIKYISNNILDLKKIPRVDFIIYCLRSQNLKISNNYFDKFLKLLNTLDVKPKILFTSSGAVYGKKINKKKDIENNKINLNSIKKLKGYKKNYALEKVIIEKKIASLGKKKYKVSIARCYTFVGKNILKYKYAVSDLINDSLNKPKILIKSKIKVYRSYMHSYDLANWLILILKNSKVNCPIYNVGSDKTIRLDLLAKQLAKITKKKLNLSLIKSNNFDYYVPNINKAKKELNLKISINLNRALNSIIKSQNE